jgi:hypothetical protein
VPLSGDCARHGAACRDGPALPNPHSVTPPQRPPQDCGKTRISTAVEPASAVTGINQNTLIGGDLPTDE